MTILNASDLHHRKQLGRLHLCSNQVEAALDVFAGILRDDPDDADALLAVGDFYLAGGQADLAGSFYRRAERHHPGLAGLSERLQLTGTKAAPADQAVTAGRDEALSHALAPRALAHLTQALVPATPGVPPEAVGRAAVLMDVVLSSARPSQAVAEHLDEINALLPALLELNIRQARADGRADLARALQQLRQAAENPPAIPAAAPACPRFVGVAAAAAEPALALPRVHLLQPAGDSPRAAAIRHALALAGCALSAGETLPGGEMLPAGAAPEAVLLLHLPTALARLPDLIRLAAAGTRLILDLDADYDRLPPEHPDALRLGLASPDGRQAYQALLRLAHLITVPAPALADTFRAAGHQAAVLPELWSRAEAGRAPSPSRAADGACVLGWLGADHELPDLAVIQRALVSLAREFPHVRVLLAGSAQAYRLFKHLPEEQRLFLPLVTPEDRAQALAQLDVLLVPSAESGPAASDRPVLQAGRHRRAWIATPSPAIEAWGAGGLLAGSPEAWQAQLRRLVADPAEREQLAQAGWRQAQTREVEQWAEAWRQAVCGPVGAENPES